MVLEFITQRVLWDSVDSLSGWLKNKDIPSVVEIMALKSSKRWESTEENLSEELHPVPTVQTYAANYSYKEILTKMPRGVIIDLCTRLVVMWYPLNRSLYIHTGILPCSRNSKPIMKYTGSTIHRGLVWCVDNIDTSILMARVATQWHNVRDIEHFRE